MSLFAKTLLLIIALFAVIAATTSVLFGRNLYMSLSSEYESKGVAIAQGIADSSTEILLNRNLATVQAAIDEFQRIKGVGYVFVSDNQAEIVSHTFVPAVPSEVLSQVVAPDLTALSDELRTERLDIEGLGSYLHVRAPILSGVAGYVHVGMDLGYIREAILDVVIKQQLLMIIIFLVVAGIAYVMVGRISRPLTLLADYTHSLAASEFSNDMDIPLAIERLSRRHADEIGGLAESFITMEERLQSYLRDLEKTTAEKQRIESELSIAHDIQMSMVPKIFPPFPERREFDLYARLVSAREVGGDFYDFFFIDDNHLCFAIGDVSGKGIPASLFMALTKTLFRATANRQAPSASDILTRMNAEISRDNVSCMFVTVFCGVLNTSNGEVVYCNAGHNDPILVKNHVCSLVPRTGNPALGVSEEAQFAAARFRMEPGDRLLLYTDGVTEALNRQGDFFGERRLEKVLEKPATESSQELITRVVGSVDEFTEAVDQSDDITLLALRFLGEDPRFYPELNLEIGVELTELPRVTEAIRAYSQKHGVPGQIVTRLHLALDEVLANIIKYGFSEPGIEAVSDKPIRIEARWDGSEFVTIVTDYGKAFNPIDTASPDIYQALDEREPGGLGIHLVKNTMDELNYCRVNFQNQLTMTARMPS